MDITVFCKGSKVFLIKYKKRLVRGVVFIVIILKRSSIVKRTRSLSF